MCEITSENFSFKRPMIETAIKECTFISLDMEFSKLHEAVAKPFTYFDTTEERYIKLRHKVSDITCIQLGLAIFTYDSNNKQFKTCIYSFYTYPQTFYKSDSVVNFQTSCVEFLCKHKFDFNKLFHNRVPYLTDKQEITIKSDMLDKLFFDKYFESNLKFRSIEEELIKVLNTVSEWYNNAQYGEYTFLEINGCNEPPYIILLQYHLLKTFKEICLDENKLGLTITKIQKSTSAEVSSNQIFEKLKLNLFDKMMGIKHLLNLISKTKKPLVGHNCALDILILCNQFFKPLPENYRDFQDFVLNNFGPIYDTKLLCKEMKCVMPKKDKCVGNSLPEIYSYLHNECFKIYSGSTYIEITGIKEPENMKLHHAGWDAYYTGYCYIKMIHIIKHFSSKSKISNQKYTLTELLKSIEGSKNKLYTYRSISNYIDLEDNYNHQNEESYFVIQNKGFFYKALDLKELKYDLKQICNFDIKLLSIFAALIIIPSVNNNIINNIKSKYMVERYSHYKSRKRKHIFSLGLLLILSTSITVMKYLRK